MSETTEIQTTRSFKRRDMKRLQEALFGDASAADLTNGSLKISNIAKYNDVLVSIISSKTLEEVEEMYLEEYNTFLEEGKSIPSLSVSELTRGM